MTDEMNVISEVCETKTETASETVEGFRLSPQQRRLWPLQQAQQAEQPYRAVCGIAVDGEIDPGVLEGALEDVVGRHEILRTAFQTLPGMTLPVQVITNSGLSLSHVDLTDLNPEAQRAGVERLYDAALNRPIEPQCCPLLQVSLVTLAPSKRLLIASLPALCADPATLANLLVEIKDSCAARLGHPELDAPVQHADLSEWQNEILEAEDSKPGCEYWRAQSISELLTLKPPFERRSDDGAEFAPRCVESVVDAAIYSGIKAVAEARGTTTPIFMLACWHLLLGRLTGKTETVIGVAYDGRKYKELERALGLFAKYLPVRCVTAGGLSFVEVLKEVEASARDHDQWQECFAWELVERTAEAASGPSFFPFAFESLEQSPKCAGAGATFSLWRQYLCFDRFKVKLSCVETNDSMIVRTHWDASLFSTEDVERLAGQFQLLLAGAVNHPEAPVANLEILSDAERRIILFGFNETGAVRSSPTCVHQLFAAQAERTPERVAVMCDDGQLSYAELNLRANQLANYLRRRGVGAEVRVAICAERSLAMMVGMLGVLKAGGAYVPLDTTLPQERLRFMLEESQSSLVLTQQHLLPLVEGSAGVVISLDAEWDEIARESEACPASDATPENLVYVMFTSGSTGKPKGVGVEHRQLVNYLSGIKERLQLCDEGAHFATVSTFAADLGHTSIFPSLCFGGCLHVVSQECASDAELLANYFARHPIDYLKIVPSHLAALLVCRQPEKMLPRRWLILGGEVAGAELLERLRAMSLDTLVLNHYGPTETTVGVLTYERSKGRPQPEAASSLPLGRPLPNTQIYLLDSQLRPVPVWAAGEVYIGGESVTRGYLNRPDLTAEKFVPHPFATQCGARLYRTGDIARFLPDGNVEFIGRVDNQVKIRGYRIELGEIEAALSTHPSVRQVVATVREDVEGDRRIVAYVVADGGCDVAAGEWRGYLQERLPAYMVPSTVVKLERLPLNANGKIDRHALPAPSQSMTDAATPVTSLSPVEELLTGIWGRALGVEGIGAHDNFFEMGGHSLLATQVMSRVRESCQVEMPLRALFESPTVAELAVVVEAAIKEGTGLQAPSIEPVSRGQMLPLSFAQQRLWFLDQFDPNTHLYNIPSAVRLMGRLDVSALERTLSEIMRRHEVLRTVFAEQGRLPVQVINPAEPVRLAVTDLSGLEAEEREAEARRLASAEAQRPFDLAAGPLLRASLLRLGDEEHVALFTMHHIVSDGWSMGVLVNEVATLYRAFLNDEPSPLPELPIQYADYAHWQREWLRGEVLERQLAYWREQLAGAPPLLQLSPDKERPEVQSFEGESRSFALSPGLSKALRDLSRREGVTLFMTLLAAFQVLLYRHSGQADFCVGAPIANRNRAETEGLIGFFVNTLVLRSRIQPEKAFTELLSQVRETALGAYAHQDLPFEKLVEDLQPKRNPGWHPLFQVMFELRSASREALELCGLKLSVIGLENRMVKFDLGMSVLDTGEELVGALDYKKELFDEATAARLLDQWRKLLEKVAADPEQSPSEISLLSEAETGGYKPSDFPEADLNQQDFENLMLELGKS